MRCVGIINENGQDKTMNVGIPMVYLLRYVIQPVPFLLPYIRR